MISFNNFPIQALNHLVPALSLELHHCLKEYK